MKRLLTLALIILPLLASAVSLPVLTPANGDISLIIGTNPPAGSTWILGPGVFYCSNWFKCPTNGAIIGQGPNATILVDCFTNAVPTALIALTDNSYIADLTITNLYGDAISGGTPASCIGTHQNLATADGSSGGQTCYTNFLGNNLILYGGSDTWYNRFTNRCQGVIKNSKLFGFWDLVTAFNAGPHYYDFRECDFVLVGTQTHVNASDILVANFNAVARFRCYNCTFYMTNSFQNAYYFNNLNAPSTQWAEFFNCVFTNGVPSADDFASGGTSGTVFVNCQMDPTKYTDGGGSIQPVTFRGPQAGTNLFGPLYQSLTAFFTNGIAFPTNGAPPVGDSKSDYLWNSNKVIFWVTNTKTNVVSDGR